jgi:histidine decarboxylase
MKESTRNHFGVYTQLRTELCARASYKMGYPESMLSSLRLGVDHEFVMFDKSKRKFIDHSPLGIMPDSLAEMLILNVGNPWKDSESFLMEVKNIEREVFNIFGRIFCISEARGYITSGGTEANLAALWWAKRSLMNQSNKVLVKPILITSKSAHYSIKKIAEILELEYVLVEVNNDHSINITELKNTLIELRNQSIIMVLTFGTTTFGGLDNIELVSALFKEIEIKNYTIHIDGALNGITMPFIKPYSLIDDYFTRFNISTLSISGHKFLGSAVCGVLLTTQKFLQSAFMDSIIRNINYCGNIDDITVSGCRAGINVLMLHNVLLTLNLDNTNTVLEQLVEKCFEVAQKLKSRLQSLIGHDRVICSPNQFNVVFPKPSLKLVQKYSLMPLDNQASISVLPNITYDLINDFIVDYVNDQCVEDAL